ncbi:MAG: hypothetical protein Q4F65_03015 [Propionibacteriaceae bacterium]|nr:hypothetical protein [Propionibacteriaceae bacterium]
MFHWVAEPAPTDPAEAGLGQEFPTQADAEAWLSASYEDLADAGVDAVSLCEGDRVVYGPMSLHA